jgi:energy-converting hydrogenase Eha subunit G
LRGDGIRCDPSGDDGGDRGGLDDVIGRVGVLGKSAKKIDDGEVVLADVVVVVVVVVVVASVGVDLITRGVVS